MVLRVAGRVGHAPAPSSPQPSAARRRASTIRRSSGTGTIVAPEPLHVVAVEPRRAGDELRGVDDVPRAALVDGDHEVRPAAHERAGRAGVVEVDVRQQDRARDASPSASNSVASQDCGPGSISTSPTRWQQMTCGAPEVEDVDLLARPARSQARDDDVRERLRALARRPRAVADAGGLEAGFGDAVQEPLLVDGARARRRRVARRARSRRRRRRSRRSRRRSPRARSSSSRYAVANSRPSGISTRRASRSRAPTASGRGAGDARA